MTSYRLQTQWFASSICWLAWALFFLPASHCLADQIPIPSAITPATPPPSAPQPGASATPVVTTMTPSTPQDASSPGIDALQPTDKTPLDVALPSPIPLGRGFLFSGAVDLRYRHEDTGKHNQSWINETELDIAHPITRKGVALGNVFVQIIGENPQDAPNRRDILPGEAYVLYKLPIALDTDSTAYVKVGQFQIPFGLLAVYDPHLQLLQPLYSQSLGMRNDWGVAISGRYYGYLNYDLSMTSGSGPDHADVDAERVVNFRLGRTFVTRNGVVNVGGSLLSGKLPATDLESLHPYAVDLPPSGYVRDLRGNGFVSKSRIAGDGTLNYKNVTGRAEVVMGADDDQKVFGYYAEGNFRFLPRATVTAARALWNYPTGHSNSSRDAVGLTYASSSNLTIRTLYEYLRDAPPTLGGQIRHQLTVQVLLRF